MSYFEEKDSPSASNGCQELLALLAEEERSLEHLLFKLKQQHLVLMSGEQRWLAPCTTEVEAAVRSLTAVGERREAVARSVHTALGLAAGANIATLADSVDDELTCQRLHQQQRRLRDLLDQVRRSSRHNRELLVHGLAATNDALALLGSVPTYDSAGGVNRSAGRPARTFDARV